MSTDTMFQVVDSKGKIFGSWDNSAHKLWSLRELMFKYQIADLVLMLSAMEKVGRDAMHGDREGIKGNLSLEEMKSLGVIFDGAVKLCSALDFDSSLLEQMGRLKTNLDDGSGDSRPAILKTQLDSIMQGIHNNLDKRMFMYVPERDASYWFAKNLFGQQVGIIFPSDATVEISEIGNCFAASRATACVFHCMRAAEYGLRHLAKLVKVKLTDKGKAMPVEYATWDKVINGVRSKIEAVRKKPHSGKKAKALAFYSDAADHCEYMKDIWRNEIAHARRRRYSREETLGVVNRVRDFMQMLAKHSYPTDPGKELALVNGRLEQLKAHHEEMTKSGF